jgi:ubiquinone/menaquinone biosynthesis C-methylase UbiE
MLRRLYDATWGRAFAWGYDGFQQAAEDAGMRERRTEFLSQARGRCLEIGTGTGLNLNRWPESVDELVLTEPDPHMARRLRGKVADSGRRAEVVEASAEQLPFPDASFDTVALTYVLCTVPDPEPALREIVRVLKPGGRFLFMEHVRSPDPKLARWQDRLHGPWKVFANGCHCNRDTLRTIEESPLEVEQVERGEIPRSLPLVKPLVSGSAVAR